MVGLLSIAAMMFSFANYAGLDSNNNVIAYAQSLTPISPSTEPGYPILPTIQIVSPHNDQLVPPGKLTIQGISSDDEETDCQVYADVNDITPMRNVTAAGDSGEEDDFLKWIFEYNEDYQLIKVGENELTAKISCFDGQTLDLNPFPVGTAPSNSPLSKWHTVNVTGSVGAPPIPLPLPTISYTEGLAEEEEEEERDTEEEEEEEEEVESNDDESNDDNNDEEENSDEEQDDHGENDGDGNGDSFFGGDPFFN